MEKSLKTMKKKSKKILVCIGVLVSAIVLVCGVYVSDYYHADETAIEMFEVDHSVEMITDKQGNLIFAPEDAKVGFVFYPGGKVEHHAYIPLMENLASEGILCVLMEMPFRLAVLDVNAADGVQEQYSQIENWYIGGHSLGGSMAASYLSKHVEAYNGLILFGAYSTANLKKSNLQILSIYGSKDGVMNREKYLDNKSNLPKDFKEIVIEGGNHAYFGMYGEQKGDGTATITNQEQLEIATNAIVEMVK